ncbi:hypothetical protein BLSTO_06075 [Blastocystis sp. subtype 1]
MIRSKYEKDGITEMDRIGGVVEVPDDTQMDIYTAHGIIHAAEKNCDYEGMGLAVDESVSPVIAFLHEKGCKEMVACLQNDVNVMAKGPEYVNALSFLG